MLTLFEIYQAFPDAAKRLDFENFCKLYLGSSLKTEDIAKMLELVPTYQAFPDAAKRLAFENFCEPYLKDISEKLKTDVAAAFKYLLPVYQAFPEPTPARQAFLDFCEPYLQTIDRVKGVIMYAPRSQKAFVLNRLFTIYQAFPDAAKRLDFLKFCEPYVQVERREILLETKQVLREARDVLEIRIQNVEDLVTLVPVYQAFPDAAKRRDFLGASRNYLEMHPHYQSQTLKNIAEAYQVIPDESKRRDVLKAARWDLYDSERFLKKLSSYGDLSAAEAK